MRCAIPPGALETIEQSAIRMGLDPLHGNWGSRTIASQTFQSRPVFSMNRNIRMQTEPIHRGAAWAERKIHALRVDLITDSRHSTSGIGTIRCPAQYCGRV